MFLKSLEVRGFKSFADKTELKFDKGITAVVGPNGSGKSNVSDAVRWVLGEQNARTLRGSKMEDIIFTGTEYRKAIGIASVSLTLDNSDESLPINFNEVKVTRRIYRSGESEYLINNSTCRLKDIVNLFMDTGIGKEGYSLIGQGKIDAILSGKSEDRRALLEEAAGIVKYKTRKGEAERKLKNTADNLTRINDIAYTYEERLIPLKEEKKKAEKYIELATLLKEKDVNLLISNIVNINIKLKEKESFILNLEKNNDIEKEKNKNARENLKNLRADLERLEFENANKNKTYLEKKESIALAKSEILLLKERIKSYEDIILKANIELEFNNNKISNITEEIKELRSNIDIKSKEVIENKEILTSYIDKKSKIAKEIEDKNLEINAIKQKDIESLKIQSEYLSKKGVFESKIEGFTENLKSMKINLDRNESAIKITNLTKINFEKDLNEIKAICEKNILDRNTKSKIIEISRNSLDEKNTEYTKKNLEISKLETSRDMLKNLESSYEGYNISVKKLMSHINSNKISLDIDDSVILGEIIKAKSGFEVAIETSLGGAISNIVTKDEFVAKKMIEYLKSNKLGRATFLPLSIIKGKKIIIESSYKMINGYLGIASELVKFDSKYENIVNYALGRTIICKDIDCALSFSKATSYRYRVVTLDGEVINAGGALTGGSTYQKNMGIISRKKEIENLILKIEVNKTILGEIVTSKNNMFKEMKHEEGKLIELNKVIKNNEIEVLNLSNEVKKVSSDLFNIRISSKNLILENSNIESKVELLVIELNSLEIKYNKIQRIDNVSEVLLKDLSDEVYDLIKNKEKLDNDIMNIKIKLVEFNEFIDSKNKVIIRNDNDVTEINKQIGEIICEKNASINKKETSNNKIIESSSFINYEGEKLLSFDNKAKDFEIYRAKMKEKLNKIESDVELLTLSIAKNEEEIHKNKIVYTRSEADENNSKLKLEEDYKVDIDDEIEKFIPIDDIEKYKLSIYSLKSRISSLGTVNTNAIEEFKELSEKYEFLVSEKSDLDKAKEELIGIIEDMTSKMKVIFRKNFNILNINFDATFKELFKGGSAKLILDESDELGGDIEIRVQPPGKKIQNINLMSGGEKVLSAIALLFAILRMKPTPFCILDEIEAALDDANVNRYAEFLSEFSDSIQFIVITHRKGTMEVADVMYGVTMEEKGISKVVSVDLNKKN
ncbi:chromosome segregation protein SMC [uncultured Clostridium sp.]|uniref:chromosome segregation protein SMC n=1 Tax=uncultured Clostridium sp. TaxID=59620 RepID=UPI00261C151F|nr:chromosome segregation protein SMC [uncultured Clostridium sp.]